MIKILYLMVGVGLKQTIDEIKSLTTEYVEYLKQYRDKIQTYKPLPALQRGTIEAHQAIAEHEHREAVRPEVEKISKMTL